MAKKGVRKTERKPVTRGTARNAKSGREVSDRVASKGGTATQIVNAARAMGIDLLEVARRPPQFIETPGGERLAVIPAAAYESLMEAIAAVDPAAGIDTTENEIALYDEAKHRLAAGDDELVPEEVADRLMADENPIKVWREYRNMSGRELAERSTLSAAYVSQLESGERKGSIQTLKKLAGALGVSVDDLS